MIETNKTKDSWLYSVICDFFMNLQQNSVKSGKKFLSSQFVAWSGTPRIHHYFQVCVLVQMAVCLIFFLFLQISSLSSIVWIFYFLLNIYIFQLFYFLLVRYKEFKLTGKKWNTAKQSTGYRKFYFYRLPGTYLNL